MFSYVEPYAADLHVGSIENTHRHRDIQLITSSHSHKHTHIITACGRCLPRPLRWQMCQNSILVSLLFAVVLLCSFTVHWIKKKQKKNTGSDLLRILLMHFSRVTLKTPCSSTLKSNLALPGLKAHVKLKATLGVGMKNWVAPYINQVERCTQHLDRRNGIF